MLVFEMQRWNRKRACSLARFSSKVETTHEFPIVFLGNLGNNTPCKLYLFRQISLVQFTLSTIVIQRCQVCVLCQTLILSEKKSNCWVCKKRQKNVAHINWATTKYFSYFKLNMIFTALVISSPNSKAKQLDHK